jgi:DNA-binding response OmpR family regulator
MARIFVVEDDPELLRTVIDCLPSPNYTVESAGTFNDATGILAVSNFDLIILDWKLPDGEGVDILREYRQRGGRAAALMLTGQSHIDDKEVGFSAGADDYLTKPFNSRELVARVNALLRRPATMLDDCLAVGEIRLYLNSHRVYKGEQEITLLPKEYAVLEHLSRHAGQYFSCDQLLVSVWKSDSESTMDTVVTTISRLRSKIDVAGKPSLIENRRGVGYRVVK